MKTVFLKSLGCKVNTFDSQALSQQFLAKGYFLSDDPKTADLTVINSCSVTANAEKEARYLLRRYRRENPMGKRVLTGCYAQIDSLNLAKMDEVDLLVPNEAKHDLVNLVEKNYDLSVIDSKQKVLGDCVPVDNNRQGHFKAALTLFDLPKTYEARAFVKIQDGCNGFCAYCQIPYARGASRSVPEEDILAKLAELVALGVGEIVFTGIHLGDYGEDFPGYGDGEKPIVVLFKKVLKIEGVSRLRLSSLEPSEVSDSLLDLMAENREYFCDHFHLPLQSGSDRILKLMGRQYDSQEYYSTLERIRARFPHAHISADVIPGFPGETAEDFNQTVDFIKACGLASLHVFPYSKRPNTRALRMPDHLSQDLVKARAQTLRQLSQDLIKSYQLSFMGKEAVVLWENLDAKSGRMLGKTKNYLDVASIKSSSFQVGQTTFCRLKGFLESGHILATRV